MKHTQYNTERKRKHYFMIHPRHVKYNKYSSASGKGKKAKYIKHAAKQIK